MLKKLLNLFRRKTWVEKLKSYWKELVPSAGEAETLQGELVRCIENLGDEGERNGWGNWDEGDVESVEVLQRYLPDQKVFGREMRERIHSSLNAVKFAGEHGADKGEMAYEELMFLRQCVVTWCEHHPRLIWKRQTATWLDDSPLE